MLLESMIDHEYPQTMKMEVEAPTVSTEHQCSACAVRDTPFPPPKLVT